MIKVVHDLLGQCTTEAWGDIIEYSYNEDEDNENVILGQDDDHVSIDCEEGLWYKGLCFWSKPPKFGLCPEIGSALCRASQIILS